MCGSTQYGVDGQDNFQLIAGLGNPGPAYVNTRHNAGFMTLDCLSRIWAIPLRHQFPGSLSGQGCFKNRDIILVKPMTYMNNSGQPILAVARHYDIPCQHIIIIHDDIDLPIGALKIKKQGGHGGHNGLRSITDALECDRFIRVRIGIGRGADGISVTDHVLGALTREETDIVNCVISRACEAVATILVNGVEDAMNTFNRKLST